MTDPRVRDDTGTDQTTSRRLFFKFLAASPLAALAYAGLPSSLLEPLAAEPGPIGVAPTRCADCGIELPPLYAPEASTADVSALLPQELPPQEAQEEQLTGTLLSTPDEAINVWDFERTAHEGTLAPHWDYLHLGVDDYETRVANREGFMRLMLRPRRLSAEPPRQPDLSTSLVGENFNSPLFLCPVAALQAYHTQGEAGAGRAAQRADILQMQSHVSSQGYEEIAEARGKPHWFQLYANPDWNRTKQILDRVQNAGCQTMVWTIDLLGGSNRELVRRTLAGQGYSNALCQQCHNHQPGYQRPMNQGLEGPRGEITPFTWDYLKRLKDETNMNVILKGIVTAEEAELAIEHGADGVYVSNHGGRAVNSLWSTIDSLPEVAGAVQGRVPVFIDSGVRRGGDIFKALALGADGVGIGRPYVWGLGAFGEDGVDRVIDLLHAELRMVMRQTRTNSIDEITERFVMEGKNPIMTRHNQWGFGL